MSSARAEPATLFRRLWPFLRPELPGLAGAFALSLLLAALGAAQPLLTRLVVDEGLLQRRADRLLEACLGMLALATLGYLLGAWHRAVYIGASGRALFALRGAAYAHLLAVAPRRLGQLAVGDLVTRLDGDVAEVQRFGTDAVATFISSVLTVLVVGAVMLALSWKLTALVALLLPAQLVVRARARRPIEASTRALREAAGRVSAFLIETLRGARAVQSAAAEAHETARLATLGQEFLARTRRAQLLAYGAGAVAGLTGHLVTAATFVLGGHEVLAGRLSVGTLVAFVAYLGRSAGSAAALAGLTTGYQRARVSLERVEELFALPRVADAPGARPIAAEARGELRLEAVTLGDDPRLLEAVSLVLPAGSKLLLQGASGAGKSTLADLLRRFVEPDAGRVLLDGRPLAEYRLADLRRRVVVVDHSPVLFRGTILDNLRYGHPEASEAAVLEAAVHAGVDEFVRELPLGYRTEVGEGGGQLSTGQRQRVAIARAALGDPLVVILDEATSGLPPEAARAVHAALDRVFPRRTRLVITHRGDDVERADLRLRLAGGRLELPAG